MTDIDWASGTWTTAPAHEILGNDGLHVSARRGSDAWRVTWYGFIHDSEHAFLAPFDKGTAVEVSFEVDFSAQFDQAGSSSEWPSPRRSRLASSGPTARRASARP